MNAKNFSIVEALKFGFFTVLENITFFLALFVVQMLALIATILVAALVALAPFYTKIIQLVPLFKEYAPKEAVHMMFQQTSAGSIIISALLFCTIFILILAPIMLGYIKIILQWHDEHTSKIKTLFDYLFTVQGLKASLTLILYMMLIFVGLILGIIPGIYFLIKYIFTFFVLADKNCGVIEAFRTSGRITNTVKWRLFGFQFILQSVYAIISSPFMKWVVNFGIMHPVGGIAMAHVYRNLLAQTTLE